MLPAFEQGNCKEIKRLTSIATKNIVGFLILIYFGITLVTCNEDIQFCDKRLTAFQDDVKHWQGRCLDNEGKVLETPCCQKEKGYNQMRMKVQTKLCFYKGNDCILQANEHL